jgi:hypothetical protein
MRVVSDQVATGEFGVRQCPPPLHEESREHLFGGEHIKQLLWVILARRVISILSVNCQSDAAASNRAAE